MKQYSFFFVFVIGALLAFLWGVDVSFAAKLDNPLGTALTIPDIINRILKGALGLVGSLALLMFVYGGFLWLTAMGDDKRIKQGWDTMTWSALGIAVIFASYALVTVVFRALGL